MKQADVIIVGGGVSGLSCALYTGKAGLKTVVLDDHSSQLKLISQIFNFPGIPAGTSGDQWLQTAQEQVKQQGVQLIEEKVVSLNLEERPYRVTTSAGEEWAAPYLVLAVNMGGELLSKYGYTLSVNEHVPNRKVQKVDGIGIEGKTNTPGVYVAGLLTGIPSQAVIAAGQGALVGVQIASDHQQKPFMWHDK